MRYRSEDCESFYAEREVIQQRNRPRIARKRQMYPSFELFEYKQ